MAPDNPNRALSRRRLVQRETYLDWNATATDG
jgi:hypothetical protein